MDEIAQKIRDLKIEGGVPPGFVAHNYRFMANLLESIRAPPDLKSVHLAFVHTYRGAGKPLDGQICLVAGLDRGKGAYDLFGGKIESGHPDQVFRVLHAIYRELWEEMTVFLKASLESVVVAAIPSVRSKHNLILVCAIDGISSRKLTERMAVKRGMTDLEHCFREMTRCEQLDARGVRANKCSTLIIENYDEIVVRYMTRPEGHVAPKFQRAFELKDPPPAI